MAYPSTVNAFSNPLPTDRLNSPSHSSVETAQNTGLTEVMTFVGTEASTVGTLFYDIRSANSNGGGHVQAANKGGTGQTTFNKGDLLVGQSSSVLVRLAGGIDGQILQSNSSTASGINWAVSPTNKIAISGATSILQGPAILMQENSILSVSVPASTLGTNNAVRARLFVNNFLYGTSSVLVKAQYGNNTISSLILATDGYVGGGGSRTGYFELNLTGNQSTSVQTGSLGVNFGVGFIPQASVLIAYAPGASSVEGTAANTLGITIRYSSVVGGDNAALSTNGYVVEKIS